MYIIMKLVDKFTDHKSLVENNKKLPTPSIFALRHLRNKITAHTDPVITIDHGQTGMLALLNGIRATPTLAKGMPPGFRHNTQQATYGNDGQYDARHWGLRFHNMTLDSKDFNHSCSHLVNRAQLPWVVGNDRSALVEHGIHAALTPLEKLQISRAYLAERIRLEQLSCKMSQHFIEVCYCGDNCESGCYSCGQCMKNEINFELSIKPKELPEPEVKCTTSEKECPEPEVVKCYGEEEEFVPPTIRPKG